MYVVLQPSTLTSAGVQQSMTTCQIYHQQSSQEKTAKPKVISAPVIILSRPHATLFSSLKTLTATSSHLQSHSITVVSQKQQSATARTSTLHRALPTIPMATINSTQRPPSVISFVAVSNVQAPTSGSTKQRPILSRTDITQALRLQSTAKLNSLQKLRSIVDQSMSIVKDHRKAMFHANTILVDSIDSSRTPDDADRSLHLPTRKRLFEDGDISHSSKRQNVSTNPASESEIDFPSLLAPIIHHGSQITVTDKWPNTNSRQKMAKLWNVTPYYLKGNLQLAKLIQIVDNCQIQASVFDPEVKQISPHVTSQSLRNTSTPNTFARDLLWRVLTIRQIYDLLRGYDFDDVISVVKQVTIDTFKITDHYWESECRRFILICNRNLVTKRLMSRVFRLYLRGTKHPFGNFKQQHSIE